MVRKHSYQTLKRNENEIARRHRMKRASFFFSPRCTSVFFHAALEIRNITAVIQTDEMRKRAIKSG